MTWHLVPSGFSGARVWRGDRDGVPQVALKSWPPNTTLERLQQIHTWMTQAEHLPFIPRLANRAICIEAGRVWDCCRWQPGVPRLAPSPVEVERACEAVGLLHGAWTSTTQGPCLGVLNRLRILAENEPLLRAGPNALPPVSPQLDPLLRRAVIAAAQAAPHAVRALQRYEHQLFALQPCVRDLRAEHVLFEGDRVSGIIDFGAMGIDHPAVDLARFLGDFTKPDDELFTRGVTAYRRVRNESHVADEFVQLLARSGAVCSVLGWLVRLFRREPISDVASIRARLAQLVARVEQFGN